MQVTVEIPDDEAASIADFVATAPGVLNPDDDFHPSDRAHTRFRVAVVEAVWLQQIRTMT